MTNDNDLKPIGQVARNFLHNLQLKRVQNLVNRHIAKTLTNLDHLDDEDKNEIKQGFRYLGKDFTSYFIGENDNEPKI